jgi:hypothetical protein
VEFCYRLRPNIPAIPPVDPRQADYGRSASEGSDPPPTGYIRSNAGMPAPQGDLVPAQRPGFSACASPALTSMSMQEAVLRWFCE